MVVIHIDEKNIKLELDSTLYSAEVVHKCFYWYAGKCLVDINIELNQFIVILSNPKMEWDIESIVSKIKSDLIDFKTREIVTNETKNIREMLIAKAFSNNDEFEGLPTGKINDPVGFNPEAI